MDGKLTPVILICDEHWFVGKLRTENVRVLDILQDGRNSFVQLHDIQVFLNQKRVATFDDAAVAKERISLFLLPDRNHEAASKRSNLKVEKKLAEAWLVVKRYTIEGNLHVRHWENSLSTLQHSTDDFFPLTGVRVSAGGMKPFSMPTAMINKSHVEFFNVKRPAADRGTANAGTNDVLSVLAESEQFAPLSV